MLANHKDEIQLHMQLIADYLVCGPAVWWCKEAQGEAIRFFDGTCIGQANVRPEGPIMRHYGDTSVSEVLQSVSECWEKCISGKVELPLNELRLQDGDNGRGRYVAWPPVEDHTAREEEDMDVTDIGKTNSQGVRTRDTEDDERNGVKAAQQEEYYNDDCSVDEEDDDSEEEEEEEEEEGNEEEEQQHDVEADDNGQENSQNQRKRKRQTKSIAKRQCRRHLPFTPAFHGDNQSNADFQVEPVDKPVEMETQGYESKYGKWLAFIIGDRPDVRNYDRLRAAVKRGSGEKLTDLKTCSKTMERILISRLRKIVSKISKQRQEQATSCAAQGRRATFIILELSTLNFN